MDHFKKLVHDTTFISGNIFHMECIWFIQAHSRVHLTFMLCLQHAENCAKFHVYIFYIFVLVMCKIKEMYTFYIYKQLECNATFRAKSSSASNNLKFQMFQNVFRMFSYFLQTKLNALMFMQIARLRISLKLLWSLTNGMQYVNGKW